MRGEGLPSATRFLALAMSLLYLVAAFGGPVLINFDSTRDIVVWVGLLVAGAVLMLVGQLLVPAGPRSALLVSLGAAIGGFPLFWTLVVPVAVAAIVACSIAVARRAAPA